MRSVLVTGATGFFGQGMVRALLAGDTQRICIFSRDEAKQAAMRASIPDPAQRLHWFVGDVRDPDRIYRAMNGIDLVIHAAALKRVEVGEYDPQEMVKTNVLGTMNVINAAIDAPLGAGYTHRRMIALSSDKACEPLNGYGASKLLMEKVVLGANNARGANGPIFSISRYGNVTGSTGSVIPTWKQAIRTGGVLKITDPDATRFWMTLDEAVVLVLDLASTMEGGELKVPELPAYRLGDLLAAMKPDCGLAMRVHHAGLGPGEKMHERMLEDGPTSAEVRRLTVDELRERLKSV